MAELDFKAWLAGAAMGDEVMYFTGHLAERRVISPNDPRLAPAKAAWRYALLGEVTLLQRRCVDPGRGFHYYAMRGKFRPPRPVRDWQEERLHRNASPSQHIHNVRRGHLREV